MARPVLTAFVLGALSCALAAPAGAIKSGAVKSGAAAPAPAVELSALNTHETFELRPDAHGHFGKRELRGWNRFLRCHHTGRVHAMAAHLADLIYEAAQHFDYHKVLVYAGYRAPKVAKKKGNPKSPHKKGVACDFRIDGVDNKQLRDYVYSAFDKVGVGYYPNSNFVHLDVGRRVKAFWIDYSFPDQKQSKSMYSKKSYDQIKSEESALVDEPERGGEEPQGESGSGAAAPQPAAVLPPTPQDP
jgi:uncharacterized protein YcbK (DUF882 family)